MIEDAVSVEAAQEVIGAVGVPPVGAEELDGDGTVAEKLAARLTEIGELFAGWRFDEAQNTDLAVARAALDVEKKALKLLAAIGPIDEGGAPTRRELGRGSMYSFALLMKAEDPSRNFEQAVSSVGRLAKWAGATRERVEVDMKRKAARFGCSEALRLDPNDQLLWYLAKAFFEFWKRRPG